MCFVLCVILKMAVRKDTLILDFEWCRKPRPRSGELCRWMRSELQLSVSELVGVENEYGSRKVYVSLKKKDRLEEVVCRHGGVKRFKYEDGEEIAVNVSGTGLGVRVLRVRNTRGKVASDVQLRAALARYGQVESMVAERYGPTSVFAGLVTGVRLVKMVLKVDVPNYVRVEGAEAYVEYPNQPRTCAVCGSKRHLKADCDNRPDSNSYAAKLRGRGQAADGEPASPGPGFNPWSRANSSQEEEEEGEAGRATEGQEVGRGWGMEEEGDDGVDLNATVLEDIGGNINHGSTSSSRNLNMLGLRLDTTAARSDVTETQSPVEGSSTAPCSAPRAQGRTSSPSSARSKEAGGSLPVTPRNSFINAAPLVYDDHPEVPSSPAPLQPNGVTRMIPGHLSLQQQITKALNAQGKTRLTTPPAVLAKLNANKRGAGQISPGDSNSARKQKIVQ